MKITVLMGSPNRNGSTSILVNEFKRGAEEGCLRYVRNMHSVSRERSRNSIQ